jgi:hypothetical protein
MAKVETAVPIRTDDMQKSLTAKHQIGILGRNPMPAAPATTSTPTANAPTTSEAKVDKK